MSELTIRQIKAKQSSLETEVLNLVRNFEEETGVTIKNLDLRRGTMAGSRHGFLMHITAELII